MAKNRSAEKEEFWRLVLQEQRDSGLTIKAFCEQQGISAPSLYAWKRRIRLLDAEGGKDSARPGSRMIPVRVVDDQSPQSTPPPGVIENRGDDSIEIASPSGFVFRFGAGVSPSRLGEVVAAVDQRGTRPC